MNKPWYKKGWGIVLAVLFFPIFFIWYAWAVSSWSQPVKVGVTAVCALFLLVGAAGSASQPKPASNTTPSKASTSTLKQADTMAVADKIVITPQVYKQVDGKNRYFFDIHNTSTETFNGTIELHIKQAGTGLSINPTLVESSDSAIQADLHHSRYVDLNSKADSFTYTVKSGNSTFTSTDSQPISQDPTS